VANGVITFTFSSASRNTVTTIKKNRSMKIISGSDAVEIAGLAFPLFFENFDMVSQFYPALKTGVVKEIRAAVLRQLCAPVIPHQN
jgi:hypothetical protein